MIRNIFIITSGLLIFSTSSFAIEKEEVYITAWGAGSAKSVQEKLITSRERGLDRVEIIPMTEAVYDALDALKMTSSPSEVYTCKARIGLKLTDGVQIFSLDSCKLFETP